MVATIGLVSTSARAESPTKDQCIDANESGQVARKAGRLLESRKQFQICVATSCPGPVREDCTARLAEVGRAMPSVVISARDGTGSALTAVRVTIDESVVMEVLDGRAVELEPGVHRFAFDAVGLPRLERSIDVHEGEKERVIAIVLGEGQLVARTGTGGTADGGGSTQRIVGVVVGGAGVVALGMGTVFGLNALSKNSDSNMNGHCDSSGCDVTGRQLRNDALSAATASTVAIVAGAALIMGGAVLWFTARAPTTPRVGLAGFLTGRDGSIVLRGSW